MRSPYLSRFLGWTPEKVHLQPACAAELKCHDWSFSDVSPAEKPSALATPTADYGSLRNRERLSADEGHETAANVAKEVRSFEGPLEDTPEPPIKGGGSPAVALRLQLFDFDLFRREGARSTGGEPSHEKTSPLLRTEENSCPADAGNSQEVGLQGRVAHSNREHTGQRLTDQQNQGEVVSLDRDLETLVGELTRAETVGVVARSRRNDDHDGREQKKTIFSGVLLVSRVRVKCVAPVQSAPHLLIGASNRGTFLLWDLSHARNLAETCFFVSHCCDLHPEEARECVPRVPRPHLPAVLQAFYGIEEAPAGALLTLGSARRQLPEYDALSRSLSSKRLSAILKPAFSNVHSMARRSPHHIAVVRMLCELVSDSEDVLDGVIRGKDVVVALDGCGMVTVWEVIYKQSPSGFEHGSAAAQRKSFCRLSGTPSPPVSLGLRRRILLAETGPSGPTSSRL